jgi:hypothetical protein
MAIINSNKFKGCPGLLNVFMTVDLKKGDLIVKLLFEG